MASACKSEGTQPRTGDALCAGKRSEIEATLNDEISSGVKFRRETGKRQNGARATPMEISMPVADLLKPIQSSRTK